MKEGIKDGHFSIKIQSAYPKPNPISYEFVTISDIFNAMTEDNVDSLSGGNQQKVALSKWLAIEKKLIIFDEPTRGVDVGAKTEIYRIINELAEEGVAVIIISSEMAEIIGTCDRAVVMREGKIVGEVSKENLTENNLIKLAMGV